MHDATLSDAERAFRALMRAVASIEPLQSALYQKYGVRLAGLHALRVLRDLGPVPISQFAEVLEIPRSTATNAVDRLEERELVVRVPDRCDRRVITVQITPHGLAALEDRTLFDRNALRDRIRSLAPDNQRFLADLLEEVIGEHTHTEASRRAVDDAAE